MGAGRMSIYDEIQCTRRNTVRRSIATPFNMDAAFDVSSSTEWVGSSSILTLPIDA